MERDVGEVFIFVLNCEPSHLTGGTWEGCKTNTVVSNWDMHSVPFDHESEPQTLQLW